MAKNSILSTSWNLTPLFKNEKDPAIEKERKKSEKVSLTFVNKWKNRTDYLKNPQVLKSALDDYNIWLTDTANNAKEDYYFGLLSAINQNDPAIKARSNKADELSKKIQNDIQFFELKLAKVSPNIQKKFLIYKPLAPYKHFLEKLFTQSKYLLSDAEEKILNLKSAPAYTNWVKMVSGLISKEERLVLQQNGKKEMKNFEELLSLMESKNKKERDSAAEGFNDILSKNLDIIENEFNSVLLDKKINDDLREYPRPDMSRLLGDDIDSDIVDTVVKTVSKHFGIAKRYYKLKAKLLGVKKLKYHERNVEYGKLDKKYTFEQGVILIKKTFSNLDNEFTEIFSRFVEKGQIDVFPKKGKRGGAFCTYGLISFPVYVMLNWTNLLDDVRTCAHEMGHAINDELIKKQQNALNFGTPTSTAEVASTFMEDFVIEELAKEADDETRLALLMSKLNQDVSSIFRQVAFYNFEWEVHKKFREIGYLSKETIGKIFQKNMDSYMGPAVEQSEGSENWWSYVWHFRSFFYVYSYAMGLLISKSLQSLVREDKRAITKVKTFLSTGLSESPKDIFRKLNIDITDNKFWEKGLTEVDTLLNETEQLAKKLGKI